MPRGCEDRHVGTQFDEDRHGGFAADPGQGLEKPDLGLVGSEGGFHPPVGRLDPGGVAVEPVQEVAQDPAGLHVELEAQGVAEEAEIP